MKKINYGIKMLSLLVKKEYYTLLKKMTGLALFANFGNFLPKYFVDEINLQKFRYFYIYQQSSHLGANLINIQRLGLKLRLKSLYRHA